MLTSLINLTSEKKKILRIIYIIIIISIMILGTYFILVGSIEARISGVYTPREHDIEHYETQSTIYFYLTIEIWNPSMIPRIVRTANSDFTYYYALEVDFYNSTGPYDHILIDTKFPDNNIGTEYVNLIGQIYLPMVGKQIIYLGINKKSVVFGINIIEENLTRLPEGYYRLYLYIDLMMKDVKVNPVYLNVTESGIHVILESIARNWGNILVFRSSVTYYLICITMTISPIIVKKRNKKKSKELL